MDVSTYSKQSGMTLIEILIAIAIVGLIVTIALPSYSKFIQRADSDQAVKDINTISLVISDHLLTFNTLPTDLAQIGMANLVDPFGNPYEYVNHSTSPPGKRRKDKNLVPINDDYDLYSKGEDGKSVAPLTAKASRDDIVRANNGNYVGIAEDY